MKMTQFAPNIIRYQHAFNDGSHEMLQHAPVIGDLNRWFIEAVIKGGGRMITISHADRLFDMEISMFPELSAALMRGLKKCGVVPENGDYSISINPGADAASGAAPHSIIYVLENEVQAVDFRQFLSKLQHGLAEQGRARTEPGKPVLSR